MGDVVRALEGPLAEVRGLRAQETAYEGEAERLPVQRVAVRAALREALDGTTLRVRRTGDLSLEVQGLWLVAPSDGRRDR